MPEFRQAISNLNCISCIQHTTKKKKFNFLLDDPIVYVCNLPDLYHMSSMNCTQVLCWLVTNEEILTYKFLLPLPEDEFRLQYSVEYRTKWSVFHNILFILNIKVKV